MKTCHRLLRLVDRLAETIRIVQERIRHAVATEIGQAVGQTAQDLLHALLRGEPRIETHQRDFIDREEYPPHDPEGEHRDGVEVIEPLEPVRAERPHRLPTWFGVGLGVATGLAAWCGLPLVSPALVISAAEWIALARWAHSPF